MGICNAKDDSLNGDNSGDNKCKLYCVNLCENENNHEKTYIDSLVCKICQTGKADLYMGYAVYHRKCFMKQIEKYNIDTPVRI